MSLSALLVSVALAAAPSELRWGADAEGGAPYVFEQPPGRLRGFEVELAGLLAARLGRTARHVQGPFDQLLPLLERGDVDVVLNGIEATDDRARAYALDAALLRRARSGSPSAADDAGAPATLADLRGRRVGTLPGTLAERMLRAAGAEVRTYDGGQDDPYRDLALGRTDAVLLDAPIALYYGELPELTTLAARVRRAALRGGGAGRRRAAARRARRGARLAGPRRHAPRAPAALGAVDRGDRPGPGRGRDAVRAVRRSSRPGARARGEGVWGVGVGAGARGRSGAAPR